MNTLSTSEARETLLALSKAIQQVDVLLDSLESTQEGKAAAAPGDIVSPLYNQLKALRVAYGYTPDGLLLKATPAPRGWDKVEGGPELPALLQPQAM